MMEEYPYHVNVEGDWSNISSKTLITKLQIYFQSRKKSNGGDCVVKYIEHSNAAVVQFKSSEIRDNVLAKSDHTVTIDNQEVKLKVFKPSGAKCQPEDKLTSSGTGSDVATGFLQQGCPNEIQNTFLSKTESKESLEGHSSSIVIEKLPDDFSRDVLGLLVEHISGISDEEFFLELISELNTAVVTFKEPSVAEKFLTESRGNKKFQSYGLMSRTLQNSRCVRVENLPAKTTKDLLELYFEKWGGNVERIITVPEEQAAIVTFFKQEAVDKILANDQNISGSSVSVYPYFNSLGIALYGKDRPTWSLPKSFKEKIHPAIMEFLLKKELMYSISDKMVECFCKVNMNKDEVVFSPVPTLLRLKGLTKRHIDCWQENTAGMFKNIISNYDVFEYAVDPSLVSAVEKDIRSVVKDKAVFWMDTSRGILTLAGRAQDIKFLKAIIQDCLNKASSQMERNKNSTSDSMEISPAMYFLFMQEGLQSYAAAKYPQMELMYKKDTNQLMFCGLSVEIVDIRNWILERKIAMKEKLLKVDSSLLEFLRVVDYAEMSEDLFLSKGITAFYTVKNTDVVLTGSTETSLIDAVKRLEMVLSFHVIPLDDPEVIEKAEWQTLIDQLCDTYNSSRKKTVLINSLKQVERVVVSGFKEPVTEVSKSLEDFINTRSRTKEYINFRSFAVVKFIKVKRAQAWQKCVNVNEVEVHFDSRRPLIHLSGERKFVLSAVKYFKNIAETLHTDRLVITKAGAKKYFQEQGNMFSVMIKDDKFVVVLEEGHMEEESEDEYNDGRVEDFGQVFCEVQIPGGIIISVRRADICQFKVDAVVNAANEELKHIGGVALALLKAAGPCLQECSDRYISVNGKLQPGTAIITEAGRLPCKYVVHAVGPRYNDTDKATAVRRLREALRESLNQASVTDCSSIAVPTISSGVFGFPLELCTETIAKELHAYIQDHSTSVKKLKEIHLVDNNDDTVNAMVQAVKKEFADFNPKVTIPSQAGYHGRGKRGRGHRGQSYRGHSNRGQGYRGNSSRGQGHHGHDNRDQGYHGQGIYGHGHRGFGPSGHEPRDFPAEKHKEYEPQLLNSNAMSSQQSEGPGRSEILKDQSTQEGLRIVLRKGSIQYSVSDVIVNTVSEDLDLTKGAVSKALLNAAGPQLQLQAKNNLMSSGSSGLKYGDIIITNGYNLNCHLVFHTVCPYWKRARSEDEVLKQIIRRCLTMAENHKMSSVSFPAIGTGNLGFPKDLVSIIVLSEIYAFSNKVKPQYLKEVTVVVHPSDNETVQCFIKSFKSEGQGLITKGAHAFQQSHPPAVASSQSSGLFGVVSTPTLGVHRVQVGHLSLEVSSGDITKENCDAIVNSSNETFSLKSGVSKAILDAAGLLVEQECAQIVKASQLQQKEMIVTSGGQLPCRNIIHIIGRNNPTAINSVVYSVLKFCETNGISSVAFPALGTGQGGASASAVADAMIKAVVDFVKKKKGVCLQSVKFLIFQSQMVSDFHQSMLRRQNMGVEEETGVIGWFKDKLGSMVSYFSTNSAESSVKEDFVMVDEEFEPAVFQLCGETMQDVKQAQGLIKSLFFKEYFTSEIQDSAISQFSREEADVLNALQKELKVRICVEKSGLEQKITVEGLMRDVMKAESNIRNLIRKVEKTESRKREAFMLKDITEWYYLDKKTMIPFDPLTNYDLEEAYENRQPCLKININNKPYEANLLRNVAVGRSGQIDLKRIDKTDHSSVSLPDTWEDMKTSFCKLVDIKQNTPEYNEVEKEFKRTGLTCNIIKIERIQNSTLWRTYKIHHKHFDDKNKHQNNEKMLFHGTDHHTTDKINKQGFNRSYAGKHGTMYGNGVYFAVDPSYSAQGYAKPDQQGHKRIYLARVLVGDYTRGKAGLVAPPAKSSTASDLYDSVTDNQQNPSMFVIFHDAQAYPEYLITFL